MFIMDMEKNANYVKAINTEEMVIDRRKASIELSGIIKDLCEAKEALSNGKLTKEDGVMLLDKMVLGMSRLNDITNRYDSIKIR